MSRKKHDKNTIVAFEIAIFQRRKFSRDWSEQNAKNEIEKQTFRAPLTVETWRELRLSSCQTCSENIFPVVTIIDWLKERAIKTECNASGIDGKKPRARRQEEPNWKTTPGRKEALHLVIGSVTGLLEMEREGSNSWNNNWIQTFSKKTWLLNARINNYSGL